MFNQTNVNELIQERWSDEQSFKSTLKPNMKLDNKEIMQTIYGLQISQQGQTRLNQTRKPQNE